MLSRCEALCQFSAEVDMALEHMKPRCSMIFIAPFENDHQALVSHGWTFDAQSSVGQRLIEPCLLCEDSDDQRGVTYTWKHMQISGDVPSPRNIPACCSSNYGGYLYGGFIGSESLDGFFRLDNRTWTLLPVELNIGALAGAVLTDIDGASLVLSGGVDHARAQDESLMIGRHLYTYDIVGSCWSILPCKLPIARFNHSCTFVRRSNSLFIVGGSIEMGRNDFIQEIVQIVLSGDHPVKVISPGIPQGIAFHNAVAIDDSIFVFGGGFTALREEQHHNCCVLRIDTSVAECRTGPLVEIPDARGRYGAGLGQLGRRLVLFGGSQDWSGYLDTTATLRAFDVSIGAASLFALSTRKVPEEQLSQLPAHVADKCRV